MVTWTDGTAFDDDFATWGGGHPQRGECGVFANDGTNVFWWDVPCATRRYPFVCGGEFTRNSSLTSWYFDISSSCVPKHF